MIQFEGIQKTKNQRQRQATKICNKKTIPIRVKLILLNRKVNVVKGFSSGWWYTFYGKLGRGKPNSVDFGGAEVYRHEMVEFSGDNCCTQCGDIKCHLEYMEDLTVEDYTLEKFEALAIA